LQSGRTIDEDLEKQNFGFAGQALADIWSDLQIDGHPTIAEYIDPEQSELEPENLLSQDQQWIARHLRTSQYFTQIVKCDDRSCCRPERSSYFTLIRARFLPPPVPVSQTRDGLKAVDVSEGPKELFPSSLFMLIASDIESILPRAAKGFSILPYDAFCPSIQSSLADRICKKCNVYFASQAMLKKHVSIHSSASKLPPTKRIRPVRIAAKRQRELMAVIAQQESWETAEWLDEDEVDATDLIIPEEDVRREQSLPIVSMEDHLNNPWEDEE